MMRKYFFTMAACILLGSSKGYTQNRIQLSAYFGSGISFFRGNGSVSQSVYYRNGLIFPYAVDSMANHFGRKSRGNFIAGMQLAYPLSQKWSLLLNTQYEHTGAALQSDSVSSPAGSYQTDGSYYVNYFFVSINPQLARNFSRGKTGISVHGGFEYCIGTSMGDRFDFIDQTGKKFSIGRSGGNPEVNDFRISIGTSVQMHQWGLGLNYKHGLSNFNKGYTDKAMMRLLQMRISYLIFGKSQTKTAKTPT